MQQPIYIVIVSQIIPEELVVLFLRWLYTKQKEIPRFCKLLISGEQQQQQKTLVDTNPWETNKKHTTVID